MTIGVFQCSRIAFSRIARRIFPHHVVCARPHPQQRTADFIRFGDEHRVAGDHRRAGVDAVQILGPPRIFEIDFAGVGSNATNPPRAKHEAPSPAADRGQRRAGVGGQFIGDLIFHGPGALVERDDSAPSPFTWSSRSARSDRESAGLPPINTISKSPSTTGVLPTPKKFWMT